MIECRLDLCPKVRGLWVQTSHNSDSLTSPGDTVGETKLLDVSLRAVAGDKKKLEEFY